MADLLDFMGARTNAQELAEDGIARAVEHADSIDAGWSEMAYAKLEQYAFSHFEFMTEDVRKWAHSLGLEQAPSARAWGAVALRGAREGLIVKVGYRKTQNPLAHSTPATVWQSLVYREAA